MVKPLAVGTRVRVKEAPALDSDRPGLSEVTTIVAIQYVTPEGEIVEEPQEDFQYLLDAEEPHPDVAVRHEYVKRVVE